MTGKPFAPSCERNRDAILPVLLRHFAGARHVLEVGSGTGQHAVHFAAAMPWLQWQCTDRADALPGIAQWLDEAGLPNTPPARELAAAVAPVPGLYPPLPAPKDGPAGHDAVFSANTLHIMGWPEVQACFAGLGALMTADATVVVYGPFNREGRFTSPSNEAFDAWLKARDPRSGIRDVEAVDALARSVGLVLLEDVGMPAHNRCLAWRRQR
ncbi:DUF938 domain-containing protein [Marilutibacter spongiae]|uniref:DUF938 domain-containing protein n=1 Tax=Marilutibacter spongiae TaxID=2025720 RepID=A0A7W3TNG9_9GAMM|nr:DUF938 domain-containing protein [Lysobacter spongiae]MBB1061563.1 DUF938 domain-containing protein [Lysobacter spongiae]